MKFPLMMYLQQMGIDEFAPSRRESGAQMPLPDGREHPCWESGFLRFGHPVNEEFVWWDVRSGRVALAGDYLPTVVSDDGRFGAEAKSGVLHVWELTE